MRTLYIAGFVLLIMFCVSCNKQNEWLDIKPNKADVTPATIEHYQALLNNADGPLNAYNPSAGLLGTDNYYVSSAVYNAGIPVERNSYIWAAELLLPTTTLQDWNMPYSAIGVCNIVLDGIETLPNQPATQTARDNAKGAALFYRAFAYYNLSQLFMKPFVVETAASDPGLVLRVSSDINAVVKRSSVKETFDLMEKDLLSAAALLPDKAAYQTSPSKQTAFALLAKLYLLKGEYGSAAANANLALQVSDKLIDFNTLSTTATRSMPAYPNHPEILFYAITSSYNFLTNSGNRCIVDTLLYQSYVSNDLRKTVFYTVPNASGQAFFKGQYNGNVYLFSGLATNELLLILAECQARQSQISDALVTLNKLLLKRWKTGTFVPVTAATAQDCLQKILSERRKELPFTSNIRWEDLRRLNRDPMFAKTLTRNINNQVYTLPPNDNRYVLSIPDVEIRLSGIAQNPR